LKFPRGYAAFFITPSTKFGYNSTVDAQTVYWVREYTTTSHSSPGSIERANTSGTMWEQVVPSDRPYGVTVDLGRRWVYWTTLVRTINRSAPGDALGTALPFEGGPVWKNLRRIVVDPEEGYLYWIQLDDNADFWIRRAQPPLLDPIENLVFQPGGVTCCGIYDLAIDSVGRKIYWDLLLEGEIKRANLDGTFVETVASGLNSPSVVAVDQDDAALYWLAEPASGSLHLFRAGLDGSAIEDLGYIPVTYTRPFGIDEHNNVAYFFDGYEEGDECNLVRLDLDTLESETLPIQSCWARDLVVANTDPICTMPAAFGDVTAPFDDRDVLRHAIAERETARPNIVRTEA